MFAWINLAILLLATILFLLYYVRSVSPAGREKGIGARAYSLCFHDRLASGAFEFIITANFILYHYFPLMTPLPKEYPWSWWISLIYFSIFIILCYAEEQDLLLRYGEAYADYCKNTGAFWPIRKQNEKGCGGCPG